MAAASITLTKIPLNGGVALPTMTALTSDGALIDFTKQDTKIVVLVENSSSSAAGTTPSSPLRGPALNMLWTWEKISGFPPRTPFPRNTTRPSS